MQNLIMFGPGEIPGDLFISCDLRPAPLRPHPQRTLRVVKTGEKEKKKMHLHLMSFRVRLCVHTVWASADCLFAPSNRTLSRACACACACTHLVAAYWLWPHWVSLGTWPLFVRLENDMKKICSSSGFLRVDTQAIVWWDGDNCKRQLSIPLKCFINTQSM